MLSVTAHRLCDLCAFGLVQYRCDVVEPLVAGVTTFVCADCYPIQDGASRALASCDSRLIVTWASAL